MVICARSIKHLGMSEVGLLITALLILLFDIVSKQIQKNLRLLCGGTHWECGVF